MRTLVAVAVLLLVGIAVFGFYRGWFHVSTNGTDQQSSATFTVDNDKVHSDEEAAKEAVQGLGQGVKKSNGDLSEKVKE
jgi:hypothetical protein